MYAAAPRVYFSDPERQKDVPVTIEVVKRLQEDATRIDLALDSTGSFVDQVVLAKDPWKIAYLLDDNGDLMYHLYLVQSLLRMNSNLTFSLIPKRGRYAIDSTYADVEHELDKRPDLEYLRKSIADGRLSIVEDGPENSSINLRHISRHLRNILASSDVVVGLGQSVVETMNGILKPSYLMSCVNAGPQQVITGLPKNAYYFVETPGTEKYFDRYVSRAYQGTAGSTLANLKGGEDQAMKGGIDLTRGKMGLQVQNGGQGIQFEFDSAMAQQLQNASGLTPVIIDIQPMSTSVPMFLGDNSKHIVAEKLSMR